MNSENWRNRRTSDMCAEGYLFDNGILAEDRLPVEYVGEMKMNGGYTKSQPRAWTEEEIKWMFMLRSKGRNPEYIAECLDRSVVSVSIKLKREGKKNGTYNDLHRDDKYATNKLFLDEVSPSSVLDIYSGMKSWWKSNCSGEVLTNDLNPEADSMYHEKAEYLIHKLYYEGMSFDLVDLDPFGSAYDCFDCAIKMARKAIVITYGEMGHRRFNRLDFVRRHYGIESMEEYTIGRLIDETVKIGLRSKKLLTPRYIRNYPGISRVYYTVETFKVTEQWEK